MEEKQNQISHTQNTIEQSVSPHSTLANLLLALLLSIVYSRLQNNVIPKNEQEERPQVRLSKVLPYRRGLQREKF